MSEVDAQNEEVVVSEIVKQNKKVVVGLLLALVAVVIFLVFRSGGTDPEEVSAHAEGPIPEAATAAAQAAAYAGQAAGTASGFSLDTEASVSADWDRVVQAWEEVVEAWEEADSIVAYYRAEAAAGRAVELARSAFDRESANARFLYEEARFAEDYGTAGEHLAVESAARATVVAAEAALRASNSAIEAAQHVSDERPGDAFDSVREAGQWAIEAAKAADEALWQSSAQGVEAAVAEEEAEARAVAAAAVAEEEAEARAVAAAATAAAEEEAAYAAAEEEAAAAAAAAEEAAAAAAAAAEEAAAAAMREEIDAMAAQAASILAEVGAAAEEAAAAAGCCGGLR